MAEERVEVSQDGLTRLQSATADFARTEIARIGHAQVFLSALAFEEDGDSGEEKTLGCVWVDGIVNTIMEEVNERASRRNLDLIGPHRGDVIGCEIEGSGMVWSVLSDRGEAMDLIVGHADAMIDPDGDLSELAEEMVDAFMAVAKEEADGAVFFDFLGRFEDKVRSLVRENDVFPSLEDMRAALLEKLDK